MHVDPEVCIECGICEEVAPGIRETPGRVPVTRQTLEAMAACPTGALRWSEGEGDT
jgi:ferredoxin